MYVHDHNNYNDKGNDNGPRPRFADRFPRTPCRSQTPLRTPRPIRHTRESHIARTQSRTYVHDHNNYNNKGNDNGPRPRFADRFPRTPCRSQTPLRTPRHTRESHSARTLPRTYAHDHNNYNDKGNDNGPRPRFADRFPRTPCRSPTPLRTPRPIRHTRESHIVRTLSRTYVNDHNNYNDKGNDNGPRPRFANRFPRTPCRSQTPLRTPRPIRHTMESHSARTLPRTYAHDHNNYNDKGNANGPRPRFADRFPRTPCRSQTPLRTPRPTRHTRETHSARTPPRTYVHDRNNYNDKGNDNGP
jgi:hypothetical protein